MACFYVICEPVLLSFDALNFALMYTSLNDLDLERSPGHEKAQTSVHVVWQSFEWSR